MTQHYLFAHRLLAGLLQSSPDDLRKSLLKEGDALLKRLWIHAGMHGKPSPDGPVSFFVHQVTPTQEALVIQLPPPQEPPEAYFVAYLGDTVYTLELGSGNETYLCSWNADTHSNLGKGPAPERDAFLKGLADVHR